MKPLPPGRCELPPGDCHPLPSFPSSLAQRIRARKSTLLHREDEQRRRKVKGQGLCSQPFIFFVTNGLSKLWCYIALVCKGLLGNNITAPIHKLR
jgi:hypothetical protein